MPFAVLDLHVSQPLGAVDFHEFRKIVNLLAGEGGTFLGIDPLDDTAASRNIGKDLEAGTFDDICQLDQFKSETEIGVVHAESSDRLLVGHSLNRKRYFDPFCLPEDCSNQALHHPDDIVTVDEGHLAVDLGELGLAVGPEVLVPEAADNLEVAVKAGDHEYLLEDLRRLRKRIKLPLVYSRRDKKITGTFRGGFGEKRGLYLEKTVLGQIAAGRLRDPGAEDHALLELRPAKVQIPVLETEILGHIHIFVKRERQGLRRIQQLAFADHDLHGTGLQVRIHRPFRSRDHLPLHRQDIFAPDIFGLGMGLLAHSRVENNLGKP